MSSNARRLFKYMVPTFSPKGMDFRLNPAKRRLQMKEKMNVLFLGVMRHYRLLCSSISIIVNMNVINIIMSEVAFPCPKKRIDSSSSSSSLLEYCSSPPFVASSFPIVAFCTAQKPSFFSMTIRVERWGVCRKRLSLL
jgi:hypothetical protein